MERATAHDIFSSVQASARREMERSSVGLFFSGLSGGLNISFGFMATAVAQAQAPDPYRTLLATLAYPLGFLLVILPRAQLFTENTLTPVVLALEEPSPHTIGSTLRIWGVVLLANLIGAFIAATLWLKPAKKIIAVVSHTSTASPTGLTPVCSIQTSRATSQAPKMPRRKCSPQPPW